MIESGRAPSELRAIFLTHAHPDHIGTANYFRQKYGAKIYASEEERPWVEDIDLQFRQRPIPNFYSLSGQSTKVDYVVKEWATIPLSREDAVEVIGTAGHSVDGLSYRIGDVVFIGDTVPVAGDTPIFVKTKSNALTSVDFADFIQSRNITEFFVAGADATSCVKSTVYNIVKAGYIVHVLADCITSYDLGKIDETLEYYANKGCIVQKLNETMK